MTSEESKISPTLLDYLDNKFSQENKKLETKVINPGDFWHFFSNSSGNLWNKIKQCYPQLLFPIAPDIDKQEKYKKAVLKGDFTDIEFSENNLLLNNEEGISFELHKSFCGEIPILIIPDEKDFKKIIQALLYKNNPIEIPKSMGALLLNGLNNWGKIQKIYNNWQIGKKEHSWQEYFKNKVLPFASLYKDKIILLSRKPYSNISNDAIKFTESYWVSLSHKIRLEHECTHLYTLNRFGIASNNLHDELIADYVGIVKAVGSFKKEWLLLFMGIENFPTYRKGARLQNYVNPIKMETQDFDLLISIIKNAIDSISNFDTLLSRYPTDEDIKLRIDTLCSVSLLAISSSNGAEKLYERYVKLQS